MIGERGVGFSRANLFGQKFEAYKEQAKHPLLIAMIETQKGASGIREILKVPGLDAIFIGPYDLSASLGVIGDFNHPLFKDALRLILDECRMAGIPSGIHVIKPIKDELNLRIKEGYQFIAYSIDAVFLWESSEYKEELL
jgi:2-dehydro-3-deoxyglucarate aldolase